MRSILPSRELGIAKSEAHRAVDIANMTPEAKEAIREAGFSGAFLYRHPATATSRSG